MTQQRNVLGVITEEPTLGVVVEAFLHMRFAVAAQKSGEQKYEHIWITDPTIVKVVPHRKHCLGTSLGKTFKIADKSMG